VKQKLAFSLGLQQGSKLSLSSVKMQESNRVTLQTGGLGKYYHSELLCVAVTNKLSDLVLEDTFSYYMCKGSSKSVPDDTVLCS
jgi:hypothetical protein